MHGERAYVGTYTDDIYTVRVGGDQAATLATTGRVAVGDDPSFLDVHPNGSCLYAVHETSPGAVTALHIDEEGAPSVLNRVKSGADGPCYCAVHPTGQWLLVAHYTGGAVSVLPIAKDGKLGARTDLVVHKGSSVHEERQTEPHPHSITPGPDGRFVYVPDLGTDEVVVYELGGNGILDRVSAADVTPGSGPRHVAFHPSGDVLYVINELNSTLIAFRRDAVSGALDQIETVSTLPDDWTEETDNYPADLHIHPSGRWLYGSNRGHDSIAVFEIDQGSCRPTLVGHVPTRGQWPRHFALGPSGAYLFAENQLSGSIVAFEVDAETGKLTATGGELDIPSPVCMQFACR